MTRIVYNSWLYTRISEIGNWPQVTNLRTLHNFKVHHPSSHRAFVNNGINSLMLSIWTHLSEDCHKLSVSTKHASAMVSKLVVSRLSLPSIESSRFTLPNIEHIEIWPANCWTFKYRNLRFGLQNTDSSRLDCSIILKIPPIENERFCLPNN